MKLAENSSQGMQPSSAVSESRLTITQKGSTMGENTKDDAFVPDIDLTGLSEKQRKVVSSVKRPVLGHLLTSAFFRILISFSYDVIKSCPNLPELARNRFNIFPKSI